MDVSFTRNRSRVAVRMLEEHCVWGPGKSRWHGLQSEHTDLGAESALCLRACGGPRMSISQTRDLPQFAEHSWTRADCDKTSPLPAEM